MNALTRNQVRAVDRMAIDDLGIPGIVLMENASRNATELTLGYLRDVLNKEPQACRVAVCCGGGNNGGDGYAMARLLHNAGVAVQLHVTKPIDQLTGDAAINAAICQAMALPITHRFDHLAEVDLIVDALLGTGFSGQVREPQAEAIRAINAAGRPIVAVDVPSGLDCDTGEAADPTVRAAMTVTFVAEKVGFAAELAAKHTGQVVVVDIGAPPSLIERARHEVRR